MMTIKEAMCYLHNPEDEDCYNAKEVEAYKTIIKALEQTEVLDKIRAEIDFHATTFIEGRRYIEKDFALDIIDKYKAGSDGYEVKVITRGNCMMCGKELTEGLFFCKECAAKVESEG